MFTGEDAAGPIALGLIGILVTAIIAAIIDVLQKPIKIILKKCRGVYYASIVTIIPTAS